MRRGGVEGGKLVRLVERVEGMAVETIFIPGTENKF